MAEMGGVACAFATLIWPEKAQCARKKGEFRDGTILIKELVSVGSKAAVSGNGYFMGEFIGLEYFVAPF